MSVAAERPDVRSFNNEETPLSGPEVTAPITEDNPGSVVIGKFEGSRVDNGTLPPAK